MARRVFFSFHYERDIQRACVVRNSWMTHADRESAGFWDASLWEETQARGYQAVKRLIDDGLKNTSVTAVLIGSETASRPWVKYEISESINRGNGLIGIRVHNILDWQRKTDQWGQNPFDEIRFIQGRPLSSVYPTYDWVTDDGYQNLGRWVEAAAQRQLSSPHRY